MVDTGALRTPGFWLRVVQLVFGIIAFATIADASGWSRANYAIFCGVVTMIISLALIACLLLGISGVRGVPCLIYDTLFFVFWLACAAALSDSLASINGIDFTIGGVTYDVGFGSSKSRLEASVAFSWLTWFAFIASIVLDVLDVRRGSPAGTVDSLDGAAPTGADAKAVPAVATV